MAMDAVLSREQAKERGVPFTDADEKKCAAFGGEKKMCKEGFTPDGVCTDYANNWIAQIAAGYMPCREDAFMVR